MVKDFPKIDPDEVYCSTQAARLLGIHRNTLIRYTRQNLINTVPNRSAGWNRYYKGADLLLLWKRLS